MRYALIGYGDYSERNIGNQVQCIAGMAFLPYVNELVLYHKFAEWKPEEITKIICNQFFYSKFFEKSRETYELNFPAESIIFHEHVDPLFCSLHISPSQANGKVEISDRVREYLIHHGPVGTRDLSTMHILQENNIPAFFSGCLTLTLNPKQGIQRKEYILTTDLSQKLLQFLRKKTFRPIYDVTPLINAYHGGVLEDLYAADLWLDLLQSASCVITPRMHVSCPCLALGTPVLLAYRKEFADFSACDSLDEHPRFGGYANLLRHATEDEYMDYYEMFNLDNPPANSDAYKRLRGLLIKRVKDYLGENSAFREGASRMTILDKQCFMEQSAVDEFAFSSKIRMANKAALRIQGNRFYRAIKRNLRRMKRRALRIGISPEMIAKFKGTLGRFNIFW